MKRTLIITALVTTVWMFNSMAQSTGLQGPSSIKSQGGSQGSSGAAGGQHHRLSPDQLAKRLLKKFDANSDGELSQDELTKALQGLRAGRQHGAGQGGMSSGSTGTSQSNQSAHWQGSNGQGGQHKTHLSADQLAAKIITKYASDKKGVTESELAKAITDHRAKHGQHQHGSGQQGGVGQGGNGAAAGSGTGTAQAKTLGAGI